MGKLIATIKAVITRIIFGAHSMVAIWQVTQYKKDLTYWYLCAPIGVLVFEGIFTLAIKKNQEWRWFCPSVFLYLGSVVPAIWFIELDKVERRLNLEKRIEENTIDLASSVGADLKNLDKLLGVQIKLPNIEVDAETWVTLIEQFLMLVLIVGRWMLPKGDLTRDQLSQLLLVYIGTAADIIEFFDSFKDSTIASEPLLVFLTLGIWSWSLMQFTIVLSATRSRKPRGGGSNTGDEEMNNCCGGCCCSIDVWGIALNIVLQDAPFLTFRLLIIVHYRIISYMNVFFTCKNTLVILLQLYRLYVVHSENRKSKQKKKHELQHKSRRSQRCEDSDDIYIVSRDKELKRKQKRKEAEQRAKKIKQKPKKDTGYSTASSPSYDSNEGKRKKNKKEVGKIRKNNSKESKSSYHVENEKKMKKKSESKERIRGSDESLHDKKKEKQKLSRRSKVIELNEITETSDNSSDSEKAKRLKAKSNNRTRNKKRSPSTSSVSSVG